MRLALAALLTMALHTSATATSYVLPDNWDACVTREDAAIYSLIVLDPDHDSDSHRQALARFAVRQVNSRNEGHPICTTLPEHTKVTVTERAGVYACVKTQASTEPCLWMPFEKLNEVKFVTHR